MVFEIDKTINMNKDEIGKVILWNGVGAPAPAKNSVGLDSFTLIFDNEGTVNK